MYNHKYKHKREHTYKHKYKYISINKVKKYKFPLQTTKNSRLSSIVFYKSGNCWNSKIEKPVMYFNHFADSTVRFIKSSDSIQLIRFDNQILAQNHFSIHSYLDQNLKVVNQKIFNFITEGELEN
jgi:hypothetical protein